MSLIEIKIINSFNNKSESTRKKNDVFNNSTLNNLDNEENSLKVSSFVTGSLTNYQETGNILINNSKENKKLIIREIIIGTICTVLGAIISYFIFGIK